MKIEELILGKSYRVKSKKWFDKNKNDDNEVVKNGVRFSPRFCGFSMKIYSFEKYYNHDGEVEVSYSTEEKKWNKTFIPPFALEPDPTDTKEISKETYELIEIIKSFEFIHSSRNASGGGSGMTRETKNIIIIPGFDYQGNECIQLPGGDSCTILWDISQIRKLIKNKKIEHGWDATQFTHIRDSVELGSIEKNMPADFKWCS